MTRQLSLFPLEPKPKRKRPRATWPVIRDLDTFMPVASDENALRRRWTWPGREANDCGRLTPLTRVACGDTYMDIDEFYAAMARGDIQCNR